MSNIAVIPTAPPLQCIPLKVINSRLFMASPSQARYVPAKRCSDKVVYSVWVGPHAVELTFCKGADSTLPVPCGSLEIDGPRAEIIYPPDFMPEFVFTHDPGAHWVVVIIPTLNWLLRDGIYGDAHMLSQYYLWARFVLKPRRNPLPPADTQRSLLAA